MPSLKIYSIKNTFNHRINEVVNPKVLRLDRLNIHQTKLLNKISFKVRKKFDDYIAKISLPLIGNLNWLVSAPASRDLYLSNLFRNLCDLYLIKQLLANGEKYNLIIVDSFAFKKVLKNFFELHGYKIKIKCKNGILKCIIVTIKRFLGLLIYSLIRCFVIGQKTAQLIFPEGVTLLDCFILKSSIRENKYHDRYYPGLLDSLDKNEKKNFYYLPEYALGFYDFVRIMWKVRKLEGNFLIKDDFLKLSDYFFALISSFRVIRIKISKSPIDDFELLPLVKYELYSKSFNLSSNSALLNYRFVKRLRKRNIKVNKLINWNENQVIDKGLIFGFHKFYPDVKILGYRGYTISNHYIHVFPTRFEKASQVIPDIIAVTGKALIEPLKEFCSDLRIVSAPAFRFSHLWKEKKIKPNPETFTVLVALPLSLEESSYILNFVSAVHNKLNETTTFLIKSHPINTQQITKKLLDKSWPTRFKFISGDFCSAVESSNLLISKNSCVCVETIAKGVPVIIIGSKSDFLKNPIPSGINEKIWKIAYSEAELLEAINFFRSESQNTATSQEYQTIGIEVRDKYFEPVKKETIKRFLAME